MMELSAGQETSAYNLFVTWNSGRQGDAMPSLAMSELIGWWEGNKGEKGI